MKSVEKSSKYRRLSQSFEQADLVFCARSSSEISIYLEKMHQKHFREQDQKLKHHFCRNALHENAVFTWVFIEILYI